MNDRVVCVMSVGAGKYRKQYELVRDNLMAYAKKCHADFRFIDDYIDKDKKRDIYSQKLLIPDYLREYEQVLFLDLDIIISPDCPDIFALMPENIGLMAEVNPRSSARFRKIYADNERILNETVEDYFTSRGFAAADGLVGIVSEVGPVFAKVTTILDVRLNVACQDVRTQDVATISGDIEMAQQGRCKMSLIPRESGIAKGDIVQTAGTSGLYPQGIVVGRVSDVGFEPQGTMMYAVVEPANDIKSIKDVVIITSFKGQGSSLSGFEQDVQKQQEN